MGFSLNTDISFFFRFCLCNTFEFRADQPLKQFRGNSNELKISVSLKYKPHSLHYLSNLMVNRLMNIGVGDGGIFGFLMNNGVRYLDLDLRVNIGVRWGNSWM